MKLSGNTILITGGASGIGLAFAERFLQRGNQVIVIGRSKEKLQAAKEKFPQLYTHACDVSIPEERGHLFEWITSEFPHLNILVNNAGIQQRVNLLKADHDWDYYQKEIAINIEGPIHLSMLMIPHFRRQKHSAIVNVSSGLALTPGVWVPIYSATKAAIHAFTISLRHQVANSGIEVIEIFPPAVNTDLGGAGLHTFGAPLADFANTIFTGFENNQLEIGYGGTEDRLTASREEKLHSIQRAWEGFLKNNPDF